ncbi:MAG: phage holin family protein, partial [Polyangiaceae bacterium]
APTGELLREALEDARELVQLEVNLARDEVKQEIHAGVQAAIAFGVSGACAILVVAMICVAIVLAIGTPVVALLFGLGFLVVSAIAAALGYSRLPKKPLPTTRARVERDVQQLKEHVA